MGLPDGHVTDPDIGISRNDQLKALGNGVVPQQAALAVDVMLKGATDDLRNVDALLGGLSLSVTP
jgi:DNA (cytosine-5)-methyltransferase 1